MLHKTRGIILKSTPYSESSLVVQIFTEKFGVQSYLLQGVRKNKSKIRTSMLQPLHLLQMVVYHKENSGLQRISELRNEPILNKLSMDVIKTSVSLFICELLYQTLKEQPNDEDLFEFVFHAIELLDLTDGSIANFPLWFMLKYSKYIGFYPQEKLPNQKFFDLKNAQFLHQMPDHPLFMDEQCTLVMHQLMCSNFEELQGLRINPDLRKQVLLDLLRFYDWHLPNFKGLKSHHVLELVLN
jgi:DNA repair protein RecO (recombination protein O)